MQVTNRSKPLNSTPPKAKAAKPAKKDAKAGGDLDFDEVNAKLSSKKEVGDKRAVEPKTAEREPTKVEFGHTQEQKSSDDVKATDRKAPEKVGYSEKPEKHEAPEEVSLNEYSDLKYAEEPTEATENAPVKEQMLNESSKDLQHRAAMVDFLKKMKQDVQVNPEELIAAFSMMSSEQLMQPPEVSVDNLLDKLQLDPQNHEKAKDYFLEMLKATDSSNISATMGKGNPDVNVKVLSKKDFQTRNINRNIDAMSQKFFVKNNLNNEESKVIIPKEMQPVDGKKISAKDFFKHSEMTQSRQDQNSTDADAALDGAFIMDENLAPELPAVAKGQATELPIANALPNSANTPVEIKTINWSQMNAPTNDISSDDLDADADVEDSLADVGAKNLPVHESLGKTNGQALVQAKNLVENGAQKLEAAPKEKGLTDIDFSALAKKSTTSSDDQSDSAADDGADDSTFQDLSASNTGADKAQVKAGKNDFVLQTKPEASKHEEAANMKQLADKTDLMVSRGGGEMKMKLSPEGLGEVTMKVNVKNGVVNVEMVAETNEAKKMIEKGLGDLKASLAANKLNVEHIKVDTSNDSSTNFGHKNFEQERQFAQQFMNEFHRNNQDWQSDFIGSQAARKFASQTEDKAQNPLLGAKSTNSKGQSRRLDLVA